MKKNSSSKFVNLILLSGVIVFASLIYAVFFSKSRAIPKFTAGAYVGEISGITENTQPATFYLEHDSKSRLYLIIVFIKGWRPQAEILQENISAEMLQISFYEKTFFLSGKFKNGQYAGKVFLANETIGAWNLKKVSENSLMSLMNNHRLGKIENNQSKGESIFSKVMNPQADPGFIDWLQVKAEFREFTAKLSDREKILKESEQKLETLDEIVKDESLLKTRASLRRDLLNKEVEESRKNLKQREQDLDELVEELGLLSRITKRGKVTDLARRVDHRETSWYLANWPTEDEVGIAEEFESGSLNIDPQKLNQAVQHANEVRTLAAEVLREKEKIKQLENQLARQQSQSIVPPSAVEQPLLEQQEIQQKKKNFWEKVFE